MYRILTEYSWMIKTVGLHIPLDQASPSGLSSDEKKEYDEYKRNLRWLSVARRDERQWWVHMTSCMGCYFYEMVTLFLGCHSSSVTWRHRTATRSCVTSWCSGRGFIIFLERRSRVIRAGKMFNPEDGGDAFNVMITICVEDVLKVKFRATVFTV